jgi:alkylation response protein AidB-like acyl-CoA dehydrogenase
MTDLLERAQRLADEVLFPASLATDTAARVPEAQLQLLAHAGLFGVFGPPELGGLASAPSAFAELVEVLASGCLTTTFVWIQHHGAVQALAAAPDSPLAHAWLAELCAGRRRTGLALGGLRPGPSQLHARPVRGGWHLDGTVPWVTGWQLVDALLTWALSPEQQRLSLLIDAAPADTLGVTPLRLISANASSTVELCFRSHFVAQERLVASAPYTPPPAHDGGGRSNGSLALGVARRCTTLLGPSPLDAELRARRAQLDAADDFNLAPARAAAVEIACRASAALIAHLGSRAIRSGEHAERLAREALFLLAFGSRPAIRTALLETLGAR